MAEFISARSKGPNGEWSWHPKYKWARVIPLERFTTLVWSFYHKTALTAFLFKCHTVAFNSTIACRIIAKCTSFINLWDLMRYVISVVWLGKGMTLANLRNASISTNICQNKFWCVQLGQHCKNIIPLSLFWKMTLKFKKKINK